MDQSLPFPIWKEDYFPNSTSNTQLLFFFFYMDASDSHLHVKPLEVNYGMIQGEGTRLTGNCHSA